MFRLHLQCAAMFAALAMPAQQQLPPLLPPIGRQPASPESREERKILRQMEEKRSKQRQQKIESDTKEILRLSADLEHRISAGQRGGSLADEAEQIKKLAKRIESNTRGELNAISPAM